MTRLRKPRRNEVVKLMNATMIAMFLTGGIKHGLDIKKISAVMRNLGFKWKVRHGYDYFRVVEIPFDQQQNYLANDDDSDFNALDSESSQAADSEQLILPF